MGLKTKIKPEVKVDGLIRRKVADLRCLTAQHVLFEDEDQLVRHAAYLWAGENLGMMFTVRASAKYPMDYMNEISSFWFTVQQDHDMDGVGVESELRDWLKQARVALSVLKKAGGPMTIAALWEALVGSIDPKKAERIEKARIAARRKSPVPAPRRDNKKGR
jgi:hypothetical protein